MTSKEDIREWLSKCKHDDVTHMIVVCDTFDHSDYPVCVKSSENVEERVKEIGNQGMTRVMEVYSYSMDLEQQLNEKRAYHIETPAERATSDGVKPENPWPRPPVGAQKSSLKTYIGAKIIKAEPQDCPRDSHKSKVGDPGYKVVYDNDYVSWSPKDVFDGAYRETDGMTFGLAIEAMRKRLNVCLFGWDKDVFLYLRGLPDEQSEIIFVSKSSRGKDMEWLPDQEEILSDKWQIVD